MKKYRGLKLVAVLSVLAVLTPFVLIAWEFASEAWYDRKTPNFKEKAVVYVYPEMSPARVVDSIVVKAGVRDRESLVRCIHGAGTPMPGRYVIEPSMTSMAVSRKIMNGWEDEMSLTIAPVFRSLEDAARLISLQVMADSAAVYAALTDPELLSRCGLKKETALALILPDTYRVFWSVPAEELAERLADEYERYWTKERRELAQVQDLTPAEVAILASIVNEETKYQPEMSKVAGVYLNRLHRGMLLQADPTVAYCFGFGLKRVLNRHLEYDSPYNTYKYAGLPPGMISCAPKACIEAVLHPSPEDNLFFCASPALDGTHRFARTNAQHEANARAYREALRRAGL